MDPVIFRKWLFNGKGLWDIPTKEEMNTIELKEEVIEAARAWDKSSHTDNKVLFPELYVLRKALQALDETPEKKVFRLAVEHCNYHGCPKTSIGGTYTELFDAVQDLENE